MKKQITLIGIILLLAIILINYSDKKSISKENVQNTLKVGIDLKFPPFMFENDDNIASGFEPDLARAFGDYLNMDVKIINTDFSMLIPALQTGAVDIVISDISITPERMEKVDFSDGYRYGRTPVLISKNFYEENNITDEMSAKDFFNIPMAKFIGLSGTVGTIIPSHYGIEASEATEIGTAVMEIVTGQSDALVGSYVIFGDHNANKDTTELYLGIRDATPSGFAVKKGNTYLLTKSNEFIATLYQKGGLYEQLAAKYNSEIKKVFFNTELGLEYITSKPKTK